VTYVHDVFISYRRDAETRAWIDKHFLPLLTVRVRQELGREPVVFVDDQLESGVSWPAQLGVELGRSRVLVPLLAKDYFASDWCVQEFGSMLAREQESGLRSMANPRGLIIPAVVHDGEHFPQEVAAIQRFDVVNQFNLRMPTQSREAAKLDRKLAREAPAIAKAIRAAPQWRADWGTEAAARFQALLSAGAPAQLAVPRFG